MKVLFVIDSLAGGGAEKLLSDLLPLNDDMVKCGVLALNGSNDKYSSILMNKGVEVTFAPVGMNPIKILIFLKEYIKENSIDVIHANLFPCTYYCSIAKKFFGNCFPKLFMTEHSTDNRRRHHSFFRPIEQWIYSSYEKIICISNPVRVNLMQWLKSKEIKKFEVIYNGINIEEYSSAQPYDRKELINSIESQDVLLCIVGSLKPIKDHKKAIEVMKLLPDRYKLLIVGEGPLREELQSLVKTNNLNERVAFIGFRTDVSRIMASSDIVIITSKWEGFGLTAAEAMACGKPVVASDVEGLTEVVGTGGIVATTPEEYKNAILSLENKELYSKYSRLAIKQVKRFDIKETQKGYLELLTH